MCTQPRSGGLLPALTSVRFFAAATVALSHFTELGLLNFPDRFLDFVDGGRTAVSFFFVLSGFILAYTYNIPLNKDGVVNFYVARFARIYPVLLFSLFIAAPVTIYLVQPQHNGLLLNWYAIKNNVVVAIVTSFLAQVFVVTGWLPFASINQPWNGPAWSISCEVFFYALFPWLLRMLVRRNTLLVIGISMGAWIFQGLLILLINHVAPIGRKGFLISQFPLTHLSDFIEGIAAAVCFVRLKAEWETDAHRFGHVLMIFSLGIIVFFSAYQPIKPAYYILSPFFSTLILGLALLERPIIGLLNNKILILLGEASFSLYLIHIPAAHLVVLLGVPIQYGWLGLLLLVFISVIIFKCYEEPMRKLIRNLFTRRQKIENSWSGDEPIRREIQS